MTQPNKKNVIIDTNAIIEETGLNIKKIDLRTQYTKEWLKDYRLELILNSC